MKYNHGWKISDEDMNELLDSYSNHWNQLVKLEDSDSIEYEKHLACCREVEKWMKACGITSMREGILKSDNT